MTNELSGWIGTVSDIVHQVQSQPMGVLLIPVIVILTCCIIAIPVVPGKMIAPLSILLGAGLNMAFGTVGAPGSIDPNTSLKFILFAHGLIIGAIAAAVHVLAAKVFGKKFPFLVGEGKRPTALGDTEIIDRKK